MHRVVGTIQQGREKLGEGRRKENPQRIII